MPSLMVRNATVIAGLVWVNVMATNEIANAGYHLVDRAFNPDGTFPADLDMAMLAKGKKMQVTTNLPTSPQQSSPELANEVIASAVAATILLIYWCFWRVDEERGQVGERLLPSSNEPLGAMSTGPFPDTIVVRRKDFSHIQHVAFSSWEHFVTALPGGRVPQGKGAGVVKCDPMHIFAWVATLLIQCCIWGLVAYYSLFNLAIGILLTITYGILLYLCVKKLLPPRMAGMIWPNLPVAIGAVGLLLTTFVSIGDSSLLGEKVTYRNISENGIAAKLLFGCIFPAIISTMVWMRKLPEDPDRAPLVSNLFLGSWAMMMALCVMFGADGNVTYYVTFWSLFLLGVVAIAIAAFLFQSPGQWGSVELVSWTLNVGAMGVAVATVFLLMKFAGDRPEYEKVGWVPYCIVAASLGLLGHYHERTFPVLLSAIGLASASIRASYWVGHALNSPVACFFCFGVLGMAVIAATQYLSKTPSSADA